jgi:6-bladed beta-propeller
MIKAKIAGLLAGLIVLAWPGRGSVPEVIRSVALEEVLSVGTLDDGALVQWTGIAADPSGRIYVLDMLDYALKKFDSRGRLLLKTGRQGQGPGEFSAPRALALNGDRIYALDQSRPGLLVFDTELRYQGTIAAARPLSMIASVSPGRLAVAGITLVGQPARIFLIDREGRVLSEFNYLDKVEFYLADSINMAADADGNLYLAYGYQDRIEKRDGRGRILWTWSLSGSAAVETDTYRAGGREFLIPKKLFYKDAALDRQGHLLVLCGGQTRHPSRDVYVFGLSGTRLAMFTLPEPSHCLFVDDNGFLYARANEGLTVKKYRIVYR